MSTAPFADNRKDSSGETTTYQTVQLKDGNIWLAENFNYFLNNDVCQTYEGYRTTNHQYRANGVGLYYDWHAFAPDLQLVPAGWHIPTVDEWQTLLNCYGGTSGTEAYNHLKKGGSSGLNLEMLGGTHFPGEDCKQLIMQSLGYFWSASEGDDTNYAALLACDNHDNAAKVEILYLRKTFRINVRLVKDK